MHTAVSTNPYRVKTGSRSKSLALQIWKYKQLLVMLLPTIAYFAIFRYGPILGVLIAFQDFRPIAGEGFVGSMLKGKWVGFQNFNDFFNSMDGIQIILNTLLISAYKIIFGFPAPIILALLLNEMKNRHFKKVVQTVSYLPHFISWVILAGILRIIFSPDTGLIVPVFKVLGIEAVNFLGDARYFRSLLVISDIWASAGWGSVIYLAALSGIDAELYEAAKIDGAGRWAQTVHITMPAIASTIVIMLILRTGTVMQAGFDQVFNLYNPAVYSVSDIIDTHVYNAGLIQMRFSYTTAIGLFQSAVGFLLVLFTNFVARRMGQEGIW